MALLEATRVTKRFGEFTALDDVSVKVAPASFHALLGENGAGKSTLVKCIMGYYHQDKGQILVGGREQDIDNPRAATPEEIHQAASRASSVLEEAATVAEALEKAHNHAGSKGVVVVTGSIYIVGEAMRLLGARIQ